MKKIDIGIEMLGVAIDLYLEGKSYISVLTLSGVAELIFASYLRDSLLTNALEDDAHATIKMHNFLYPDTEILKRDVINMLIMPKNSAKHRDGVQDDNFLYDSKIEAENMLDRALRNYHLLADNSEIRFKKSAKINAFSLRKINNY